MRRLLEADRWNWYAAGDESVAPAAAAPAAPNASEQVVYEIGLLFAIPLVLAVLACLTLPG